MIRRVKLNYSTKSTDEIRKEVHEKYGDQIKLFSKAKFYLYLSKAVIENSSRLMFYVIPKVKCLEDDAWFHAYEFVFTYLEEHGMKMTLEAMKTEFNDKQLPPKSGFFDDYTTNEYFELLIENYLSYPQTVNEKANDFALDNGFANM